MARVRSQQEIALHKKLIPANIAIAILAIIAFFFQLFTPILEVTVHVTGETIVSMMEEPSATPTASTEEDTGNADEEKMMLEALKHLDVAVPISIKPISLLSASSGDDEAIAEFFASILPDEEDMEKIAMTVMDQFMPPFFTYILTVIIDELKLEGMENHIGEIRTVFDLLLEGNMEEARTKYEQTFDAIASDQGVTVSDELRSDLLKQYDAIIEMGSNEDGVFSYMILLENFNANELGSSNEEPAPANARLSTAESENTQTEDANFVEILQNPSAYLLATLEEGGIPTQSLGTYLLIAFLVMGGIASSLWLILAIFAIVHIFTENKKVAMWYVKLCNIWPFLLFWLLPTLALPMITENAGMATLGIVIGGSGIATAVCYFLLWAISIFWCHPIKKKIKRLEV